MSRRNSFGFSWSWRRAFGVSAAKGKVSRAIGIPLTRSGRQQKLGRMLGAGNPAGCGSCLNQLVGCGCLTLVGLFALPQALPGVLLLVWDGLVLAFLFCWCIGLITDLQRDGDQLRVGWSGSGRFQLQIKTELSENWTDFGEATTEKTISIPMTQPASFFRDITREQ